MNKGPTRVSRDEARVEVVCGVSVSCSASDHGETGTRVGRPPRVGISTHAVAECDAPGGMACIVGVFPPIIRPLDGFRRFVDERWRDVSGVSVCVCVVQFRRRGSVDRSWITVLGIVGCLRFVAGGRASRQSWYLVHAAVTVSVITFFRFLEVEEQGKDTDRSSAVRRPPPAVARTDDIVLHGPLANHRSAATSLLGLSPSDPSSHVSSRCTLAEPKGHRPDHCVIVLPAVGLASPVRLRHRPPAHSPGRGRGAL